MVKIFKWLFGLAALGVAGLLAVAALTYFAIMPNLPDVTELKRVDWQMPLSVYSSDGKFIAEFGENRRYPVRIEAIPAQTKNAVIAIEDAHFYKHIGLDWRGIARAVWLTATSRDERVPGGSTITQQVARNFYLSNEYSYFRKFKEMLLALKMERELSKDEILGLYLNKIFFGNRSYGIVAAADFYYGKTLEQLSLAESATLAGIPKFPSSGNPISNPERSMIRRDYILQRMAEEGFISEAQMRQAQAEPNTARPHEQVIELQSPYLAEMVRQEMIRRYGDKATEGGFRVVTTVHSKDQLAAERAVRAGLVQYDRRHGWRGAEGRIDAGTGRAESLKALQRFPNVDGLPAALALSVSNSGAKLLLRDGSETAVGPAAANGTGKSLSGALKAGDVVRLQKTQDGYRLAQIPKAQAALVALQPEDGALRAVVGGYSYAASNFNRATTAKRQPGSSFKPFVYTASFERGYSPSSVVLDAPVVFKDRNGNVWRPQNDRGGFRGPMRLREALVQSRNLVSVRLLDGIGVAYARDYITRFGFRKDSLPANLSMALGTASLTPMSVARGYTLFANGGYLIEPYFIRSVTDSNGTVISYAHPKRACAQCPERLAGDVSKAVVVDGFDLSGKGPGDAPPADRTGAAYDPGFVGPPLVALAPQTIDPRNAFLISDMMLDVVRRGTAVEAKVLERADIGGKTGSTNDHRDAWFSGFGGDLVTTVWVGKDDYKTLGAGEYGGRAALPIWISFMRDALDGVPLKDMTPPAGIVKSTNGDYFKQEQYDLEMAVPPSESAQEQSEQAYDIF